MSEQIVIVGLGLVIGYVARDCFKMWLESKRIITKDTDPVGTQQMMQRLSDLEADMSEIRENNDQCRTKLNAIALKLGFES